MNNLNNILFEGSVCGDIVKSVSSKGNLICSFIVGSVRYAKQADGSQQKEICYVSVSSFFGLADKCIATLKENSGVRIVGRLAQNRKLLPNGNIENHVVVIAEHIEFKPELDAKAIDIINPQFDIIPYNGE